MENERALREEARQSANRGVRDRMSFEIVDDETFARDTAHLSEDRRDVFLVEVMKHERRVREIEGTVREG